MNIKEHIEAGHYPTDDKGRALVPIRRGAGDKFVVLAADVPGDLPIVGYRLSNGMVSPHGPDSDFLLPPPPRKVKVIRWHAIHRVTKNTHEWWALDPTENNYIVPKDCQIVTLTGEYEEPWS